VPALGCFGACHTCPTLKDVAFNVIKVAPFVAASGAIFGCDFRIYKLVVVAAKGPKSPAVTALFRRRGRGFLAVAHEKRGHTGNYCGRGY
jgi:hypothetical protein